MKSFKQSKIYLTIGDFYNYLLSKFFPVMASKKKYKAIFGRKLDLNNPTTFNEKLMFLKLKKYWNNPNTAVFADKYAVRQYVKDCGCEEILTKLYGVYENAKDIEWKKLPNQFAIKCNHGSGYNIVCRDKTNFNKDDASRKLNKWLKETYGIQFVEQGVYKKIQRRILAEEFIKTSDGSAPKDYKFFCSYGKVLFLFVASERVDGDAKFDYFEPDWTHINVKNRFENAISIEKPKNLKKMIEYAEKLSKPFPMVRIDLYSENDSIYFGEITLTHFGCLNTFEPDEYDYIFGSRFPDAQALKDFKTYDKR